MMDDKYCCDCCYEEINVEEEIFDDESGAIFCSYDCRYQWEIENGEDFPEDSVHTRP